MDTFDRRIGTAVEEVRRQILSDKDDIGLPALRDTQAAHEEQLDLKLTSCLKNIQTETTASEARLQVSLKDYKDTLLAQLTKESQTLHDNTVAAAK